MKTTDWIATMPPKCREAFKAWAADMWMRGGLHGLVLSEALWESAPGKIDGMDSADRLLKCMEAEGWIERGKLELHIAARRISASGGARLLDFYWMPRRASVEFRDYLYPPEVPRGPMVQLTMLDEVTP